jgi:hypothetical protein
MRFATLDMIVNRSLLEKGKPKHWYIEYLSHAAACIRDLTKDTLKIVNSANLPVNDYGAVDLPDDFVDDIAVNVGVGQSLQRLPKQDWITPLRVHSGTTGLYTPYAGVLINSQGNALDGLNYIGNWGGWFWNVNDFAEPTGRFFGAPGGTPAGYALFKERRQIQLTENFIGEGSSIVLLYVSDGQSVDNASQVDFQAFTCVQRFIDWMSSPNAGIDLSPQGAAYYNARRLLRANLNDLTRTDILNIFRNSYMASIKS